MKTKINMLAIIITGLVIFFINIAQADEQKERLAHQQVINYYSYPYPSTNSFYYKDNAGNFISSATSIHFPGNGYWAIVSGQIPPNAVIYYNNHNGVTTYYCRGYFNHVLYYGEFFPNEGCYIKDPINSATLRLESNFELFLQ